MKLTGREAAAYFRKPDPKAAGLLIYGEDAMRVALRRQEVVAALIGPEGEAEMRLTRIAAADLRRDGAMLMDALKATGFFPGPRVVLLEGASDGLSDTVSMAMAAWQPGDAQVVVTAGVLAARSKLRKLFEGHKAAYAAGLYNTPPDRAEIEAELGRAGLKTVGRDAMAVLEDLGRGLGPGDFRQTVEKIALYKLNDPAPLSPDEVWLCAPATLDAEIDDVLHVLAEGRMTEIAPVMMRLQAQGATPVSLLIMATRHYGVLHQLASAPGGPRDAIGRIRPPVFGPRRDRMVRQAQTLSADVLERCLTDLLDTDLTLRSAGQKAPALALVERCFVRLAHLAQRARA